MVSMQNNADNANVCLFEQRVHSCHETFFAKMKVFDILTTNFCHGELLHKIAFEAAALVCQCEIELVPLFDVRDSK